MKQNTFKTRKTRIAVLFSSRGVFPGELVNSAREEMAHALCRAGLEPILLDEMKTPYGAVSNAAEAKHFADLLKITEPDGVIVCLPNFGDESSAALACRDAGVPILIQAYPDKAGEMDPLHRRDAFCGKISTQNVFRQYGIPYTVFPPHVIHPSSEAFVSQLRDFDSLCRVVNGLRRCTVGAIGARTTPFKTVRYDELALQKVGITVETIDLSHVLSRAEKVNDHARIQKQITAMKGSIDCSAVPSSALDNLAKLKIVLEELKEEMNLDMMAFRCWEEIEVEYGCAPCAVAGLFGDIGFPVACEVDVCNAVMMYALKLATDTPSTVLDWNNNYNEESDSCVLFHCGPIPPSLLSSTGTLVEHSILANSCGPGCSWGPVEGTLKPGTFSFASSKTEDGKFCIYLGEGEFTADTLESTYFGAYGVARFEHLQEKLIAIGKNGFKHHVAVSYGKVAHILKEACGNYLGYEIVNLP